MPRSSTQVALSFSTRRFPADDAPDSATLLRETLRMTTWGDGKLTGTIFAEHHVTDDGFTTSPRLLNAAAVSSTQESMIGTMALLLPLHDPLLVAEELAALDLLSGGRTRTVLGLGYRPAEYQALGIDWKTRGRIFDEKTATLLALLRGETIEVRGVETALVHPPASPVDRIVFMGGNSILGAKRAARHRLGFIPAAGIPEVEAAYRAGCEEVGYEGYYEVPNVAGYTFVARDPDETWDVIGKYLLYDAMSYQAMAHTTRSSMFESDAASVQTLRESGGYRVVTPTELLEGAEQGFDFSLIPLAGGMPPDFGWESLELYAAEVLPELDLSRGLFEH